MTVFKPELRWAIYYTEVSGSDSDNTFACKLKKDPILEVKDPFSGYWSEVPTIEVNEQEIKET